MYVSNSFIRYNTEDLAGVLQSLSGLGHGNRFDIIFIMGIKKEWC